MVRSWKIMERLGAVSCAGGEPRFTVSATSEGKYREMPKSASWKFRGGRAPGGSEAKIEGMAACVRCFAATFSRRAGPFTQGGSISESTRACAEKEKREALPLSLVILAWHRSATLDGGMAAAPFVHGGSISESTRACAAKETARSSSSFASHARVGSETHPPHVLPKCGLRRQSLVSIFYHMEPSASAYPVLRFFNPLCQTRKAGETLPHWQQDHVTYFVTFRLADSLPASMLREWKQERESWLIANPEPWPPEVEMEYHRLFSHRIDQWLDQGEGDCLLADEGNTEIVSGAFGHFDRNRYLVHSWVIMPNHVHLLVSLEKSSDLSVVIGSWKRFTATKINRTAGSQGPVWQRNYFDRIIRDWDHFMNVARYIRRNPVKGKLHEGRFRLYEAAWVEKLLS
ncbi:MAG: hypothetical protein EOP88_14500 [Verrucomicrobiaceae bacterium]|nr:MAG: hypothetical protein EOP88_14500 [Verrucomicrobiaceae bacterium]